MNIAYILNSTISNGGATKVFMNMLDMLMPMGVRPFVVLPDRKGIYAELTQRGITTLVLTYRASVYPYAVSTKQKALFLPRLSARIIANSRAGRQLESFLRDNAIDIVHSNTSVVRIGYDAARRLGIPHIYHIREYADKIGYHYLPNKRSFRRQLSHDTYTICITKDIQRYYQQQGKPSSRVIYDGVFSAMTTMPAPLDGDYFLFAGRIQPAKGLDYLLQAYKAYTGSNAHPLPLKVAGDCSDTLYYHKQMQFLKENNLEALVTFLGDCDNIYELMRQARALIVPTPFEGFGFCMPEAMQQGCLVIGRNTSGTKEQLDNALMMENQEIALRYDTVDQLAERLADVTVTPPSHFAPMKERAFRVVNQLYTREAHAKNILQFYHDILHEKNS